MGDSLFDRPQRGRIKSGRGLCNYEGRKNYHMRNRSSLGISRCCMFEFSLGCAYVPHRRPEHSMRRQAGHSAGHQCDAHIRR